MQSPSGSVTLPDSLPAILMIPQKSNASPGALSGTESDSDSQMQVSDVGSSLTVGSGGPSIFASGSQHPLQSIAERRSGSCDESDEDEDEEGEWRVADKAKRDGDEDSVTKTGYLWKKGSRRKVRYHACTARPGQLISADADLEEAVVRPQVAPSGLLQNRGRVSTAASVGPQRSALCHACFTQAA